MEENLKMLTSSRSSGISEHDINHNDNLSPEKLKQKMQIKLPSNTVLNSDTSLTPRTSQTPRFSSHRFSSTSPNVDKDTSVFYSTAFCEESETTTGLVRDYVVCKLKRSGLVARVYVTAYPPGKDQLLRHRINTAGNFTKNCFVAVFCRELTVSNVH